MKYLKAILFNFAVIITGCTGRYTPPVMVADFSQTPPLPDYSLTSSWCALPEIADNADKVPSSSGLTDAQNVAAADVFFIHPTSYLKKTNKSTGWNADITDEVTNQKTDNGSILYQASSFNGAGKIYAPRYRQAFIYAYFTPQKELAKQAFDTAYADIKNAFEFYLKNYNHGRPFIIASHSQGTTHAIRLLKEYIDKDDNLTEKFVAGYLVGMDVYDTLYTFIKPCGDAFDTRCFVSWRTYAAGYYPPNYVQPNRFAVCTNPLTWKMDTLYASRDLNNGGILRKFNKVIPRLSDAFVQDGVLRIHKPHFTGKAFFNFSNYHIVDYNLFYFNIRENAATRVKMFRDVNDESK